jgi:hypothetical protein
LNYSKNFSNFHHLTMRIFQNHSYPELTLGINVRSQDWKREAHETEIHGKFR